MMADVTGPVSTLPGSRVVLPESAKCDEHPDRVAAGRVQGETDSFGAEFHDLCQECIDEFRQHQRDARNGVCAWCKKEATDIRPKRDYEEGLHGPVYNVCGECVEKENKRLREDEDEYYDEYD
jgi:hypothetical protein